MAAPIGKTSPAARVGQHTVRLRYRRRVADSDALIGSAPPTQWTRRMIIGFGLAAPTLALPWLAGCAPSDPAVDSPPTPGTPSPAAGSSPAASPSATPAPSNPTAGQAAREQAFGSARSGDPGRPAPQRALEGPPTASDVPSQRTHGTCSSHHQSSASACAGQDRWNVAQPLARPAVSARDSRCWRTTEALP